MLQVKLNASSSPSASHTGGSVGASFIVGNGGSITSSGEAGYTWLLSGSASGFEARATQQANNGLGVFSGTGLNVWTNCSGAPTWILTRTNAGEATATLLVEIRPVGGSTIASTQVFYDVIVN